MNVRTPGDTRVNTSLSVTTELSAEALAEVEALQAQLGCRSRSEVLRIALAYLAADYLPDHPPETRRSAS
jgi:metal-responsive CopG/Arc/MetJ family transcriptional regulator